jgi:hypothetical protein
MQALEQLLADPTLPGRHVVALANVFLEMGASAVGD